MHACLCVCDARVLTRALRPLFPLRRQLSGVAAILRFPLPELEDQEL